MKKDIAIYVSCRTDTISYKLRNELYHQIFCGAACVPQLLIPNGDNRGKNISLKKFQYSELTVQYWAWKNEINDYFGLCHYRRYLSFSNTRYQTNERNQVIEPMLTPAAVKKYRLANAKFLRQTIKHYDVFLPDPTDVSKIFTPKGFFPNTVRQLWEGHEGLYLQKGDLDLLLETIQQLRPDFFPAALAYMESSHYYGYNCYILRHDLFDELCKFQFEILFALEKKNELKYRQGSQSRSLGYLGEILFGIYAQAISEKKDLKIAHQQLVYFSESRDLNFLHGAYAKMFSKIFCTFRRLSTYIFPFGSRRRIFSKKIYHFLKNQSRRDADTPPKVNTPQK